MLYLLLPGVLLRLWWKGQGVAAYRRHWKERLGRGLPSQQAAIWLHAVSVGEVRAAQPLINALRERYPHKTLLVTTSTPTGRQTVRQLFIDKVECCYLPYDLPGAVKRFLSTLDPALAIIMEVELWPNLYAELAARGTPLYLVNARLSQRSLQGYQRLGRLMRKTLRHVVHIAAQTETDKARFLELGVKPENLSVTGNLKFDVQLPADFDLQVAQIRPLLAGRQPVWLAASTHEGEEALLLRTHKALLQRYPQALLILAPRHPERAAELAQQCTAEDLSGRVLSAPVSDPGRETVWLVDRLGWLVYGYGVADAAFIGGSLVDRGGHNPVEPLLAGVPVISGPQIANFAELYAQLEAAGAAFIVNGGTGLSMRLTDWLDDRGKRDRAVDAGRWIVRKNQGSLARVLNIVDHH